MGSTGDRAASLMFGGREADAWGRAASRVSCCLPLPANSTTHEATKKRTAIDAARKAVARAGRSINLPTDAYDASVGRVFRKPRHLARIGTIGH